MRIAWGSFTGNNPPEKNALGLHFYVIGSLLPQAVVNSSIYYFPLVRALPY